MEVWKHIKLIIAQLPNTFTFSDVVERCLGISRPIISRVLNEFGKEGSIACVEKGRGALYVKNHL